MAVSRLEPQNFLKGMAFISPWVIGFCAFTAVPLVLCFYYSTCDYSLLQKPLYRGLENFRTLAADGPIFWKSLFVTAYFAVFALPLGMLLSLGLALLLNIRTPGQFIYRTIIFLPSLVPAVAGALLWLWLLNPSMGLINTMLRAIGVSNPPGWYAVVPWAMPSLVLMSLWGVGNTVIIYLAGLQDVPRELYEAADLDGATGMKRIFHVTIPCISPVIFFNLIMAIIGSVQQFTNAYIINSPEHATYFFTLAIYEKAFLFLKMGEASAMACVQLAIILALTVIAFWSSKRWVHYQGK